MGVIFFFYAYIYIYSNNISYSISMHSTPYSVQYPQF